MKTKTNKAQVSFEYLLLFVGVLLLATIAATTVFGIAQSLAAAFYEKLAQVNGTIKQDCLKKQDFFAFDGSKINLPGKDCLAKEESAPERALRGFIETTTSTTQQAKR